MNIILEKNEKILSIRCTGYISHSKQSQKSRLYVKGDIKEEPEN